MEQQQWLDEDWWHKSTAWSCLLYYVAGQGSGVLVQAAAKADGTALNSHGNTY